MSPSIITRASVAALLLQQRPTLTPNQVKQLLTSTTTSLPEVAGDADILKAFLLYRTYHGGAMSPPVQDASAAAWRDEQHVRENRAKYREKFARVTPVMQSALQVEPPDAGVYLWARTPVSDVEFARGLYAEQNITVLPGSYLARESGGTNPGANYVRMALVAEMDECAEAARRVVEFARKL